MLHFRVKAVDKDQGRNGQVLYGLVGESSEQFEIDSVSGDLFVVGYTYICLIQFSCFLIDRSFLVDWTTKDEISTH